MGKKHNILFLNETSGPGGAEMVLYNTAGNLDPDKFAARIVLFRSGWFFNFLKDRGIPADVISSRRSWDLPFLFNLVRYSRRNNIDLIHSHLPGANLYGSVAGRFLGIPVVCTIHNEAVMPDRRERLRGLKHLLIRKFASRIVAVSEYIRRDYLAKAGFSPQKTITIHNGISDEAPTANFDIQVFRREIDFREGDILIANVANFRAPKGHRFLIEAAQQICREVPSAKFLLIGDEGDGVIKSAILRQMEEMQLNHRIKLLGFRRDIPQILRHVDILLFSSISEGLPLSVVEGMMAGRPVIATNVGGLSEAVESGVTGFLVNSGDPVALAEKTLALLRDAELRKRMGQKGRERAILLFSLENMVDKYQHLYLELLKQP